MNPAPAGPPPATIVVIDDNAANRAVLRRLFDGPEYRVVEAGDGETGLELVRATLPDCVLLDLAMPGLDGFEVLERLRQDPRARDIPVLVVTAADEHGGAMERALRAGAVDYLTKPISVERMLARVRGAIDRRRLLREMHELHSTFTSMLVHDLRSPLTIITGYLQLLELNAAALPPQHQRHLAAIRDACTRMIALISDILDVSKLEAGKLALEREAVDLGAAATEIVERMQPVADQQGVALALRVAATSAMVTADPRRLEQVLLNLLGNALKFTPREGRIAVEVGEDAEGVVVSVTDSGPGIPAAEMPLLFEKFSQASAGRAARRPGTGLGLVICRHLVEAHDGRIWVESEPGHGARFAFRLPRA